MRAGLTQRVSTSQGDIAFDVFGSGPPVVLVHGTPSCSVIWRQIVPGLASSHRVYVFDMLGFGESERHLELELSLAVHGQVLAELIGLWGLEAPAAVGHDIGGATVLRAHLIEGVPLERIALIDAVVLRPWITPRTRRMQQEVDRYEALPDADLADSIRQHLMHATAKPLEPEVFDRLFGQWEGAAGQALYLRNLAGFDERHTDVLEPLLPKMSVPTLIVWGEEDAWLPVATSERIAAVIPHANRILLSEAGHFSMEDQPEAVTQALAGFLA
jgi:pimeloyl-ACP methyl ester carboxylesterase